MVSELLPPLVLGVEAIVALTAVGVMVDDWRILVSELLLLLGVGAGAIVALTGVVDMVVDG